MLDLSIQCSGRRFEPKPQDKAEQIYLSFYIHLHRRLNKHRNEETRAKAKHDRAIREMREEAIEKPGRRRR